MPARVSNEKTTQAAEAILDRVIDMAPTMSADRLLSLAEAVALIAEHLNTNSPSDR